METTNYTDDIGCYIDSSAGQYGGSLLMELADDFLGRTDFVARWPKDDDGSMLGTYGRSGSPWAGLNGDDDIELMVSLMDEAEAALNELVAEDRMWYWADGDFGCWPDFGDEYTEAGWNG